MIFLGILMNSKTCTLEIDPSKLQELKDILGRWQGKKMATLKEIQQLIGKLNFATTMVQAGRLFYSRILEFFRSMPSKGKRRISAEVIKDINWWINFMVEFDGKTMMLPSSFTRPDTVWSLDSCLTGCGGWSEGEYFHFQFPKWITSQRDVHINELECFALTLCLKLWGSKIGGAQSAWLLR